MLEASVVAVQHLHLLQRRSQIAMLRQIAFLHKKWKLQIVFCFCTAMTQCVTTAVGENR